MYSNGTKGELTIVSKIVGSFCFLGVDIVPQYFDNTSLSSEIKKLSIKIGSVSLNLYSDRGVFSKDKLDFGTRVLLENLPLAEIHGNVLDIGCGYGPIGLYLAKTTDGKIDMCDVNKRALHLAKRNAKENRVDISIFESNCYERITDIYDVIITNPPIRAGKKIVYEILLGAKEHLKKEGVLFCVIHKDQGAKSTISDLEKVYDVTVIEKNKGFFVIKCINR